jgi:hypothetical protein
MCAGQAKAIVMRCVMLRIAGDNLGSPAAFVTPWRPTKQVQPTMNKAVYIRACPSMPQKIWIQFGYSTPIMVQHVGHFVLICVFEEANLTPLTCAVCGRWHGDVINVNARWVFGTIACGPQEKINIQSRLD